ncbi:MAG: sigma-54-dependent Fis family transcriptional regulator [Chromatiales bacterium 21-64-14]|nr:MAG: sigma-54-dependent Fis family transcriptional regulator [Chromatiales bacterium 21-64-14]HQU15712.1 sigma-54 dependent transcriptional regulator [Gammaproteobacteria bacterium]
MADTLLVIEDETLLATELSRHYRRQGWDVFTANSLSKAEHAFLDNGLDVLVVLSDMSLPDGNTLDLLEKLRGRGIGGEWIFLTGYGSVPDSVRALRLGAFDFLEKPCEQERLDMVIAGAARSARAQRRLRDEAAVRIRQFTPDTFIGSSPAAQTVRDMLAKLTQVPFSALIITGETGTGKGLAARILHHSGTRAEGPLIELNCAALPRELLESELFGHEAGAFTGARARRRGLLEQAHGGTLFLDEIGEMDLDLQAKLLKAIEDRRFRRLGAEREIQVEVQIIAASNRDLESRIEEGTFRSDLYHRLSVFRLHLPPLRERKQDLDDLAPLFVAEYNAKAGKAVKVIPDVVWGPLRTHDWPGNVRELRNVVERGVLFSEGELFPVQWLQLAHGPGAGHSAPGVEGDRLCLPLDGSMALDDMDRYIIQTALERSRFNVTAAARALGTTRETLRYRIQKYGLRPSAG